MRGLTKLGIAYLTRLLSPTPPHEYADVGQSARRFDDGKGVLGIGPQASMGTADPAEIAKAAASPADAFLRIYAPEAATGSTKKNSKKSKVKA